MEVLGTVGTVGDGNTNSSPPILKTDKKVRSYCFTLNNYTDDDVAHLTHQFTPSSAYMFQKEVGQNGTPHLQGFVQWKNGRSFDSMKKLHDKAHWEVCRNVKASIAYCSKNDTATGERYTNIVITRSTLKDPMVGKVVKDWQTKLNDILEQDPDDRTIHWIVDREGGKGKTTWIKSFLINHPKTSLLLGGKCSDMKCGIALFIEKKNDLRYAFLNFTRSMEQYVSYEGIENIKDGMFFNGKYESGMVMYNCPHVVVMSNFYPDKTKLSLDRWNIIDISDRPYELIDRGCWSLAISESIGEGMCVHDV